MECDVLIFIFYFQVPIGGAYRLIDVPMSNCINSGINKVFVLTQFNSQSLNRHLAKTYNFGNGVNFGDGFVEVPALPRPLNTRILILSLSYLNWDLLVNPKNPIYLLQRIELVCAGNL